MKRWAWVWVVAVSGAWGQAVTPALRQADAAFRAGQAAMAKGDLAGAQGDFEQAVKLAPGAGPGHSALGSVLLGRGRPREAIKELEAALALNKGDNAAQTNLAMAYGQVGQAGKAVGLFAVVEGRGKPLGAGVLMEYARALATVGRPKEAAAKMKAVVAAEPGNAEARDGLGSLYAQQREWKEAEAEFAEAERLQPGMASAHLHRGLALGELGLGGGLEELQRAAELGQVGARLELGKAYAAAGDDAKAVREFVQVRPENLAVDLEWGLALQRLGKVPEAIEQLKKVVAAEPKNATALVNLGMALTQMQQAKEGLPLLKRAVELQPKEVVGHEDLAAAYVQLNQLDDGVAELETAVKLAPGSAQIHYDLGLARKLQDRPGDAIPELEAAARLDAKGAEAPYVLGLLYMQAGRYPDAARELKRSLELRPENGDGWATLGSVYSKLDQLDEAVAALRTATTLVPEQPDPHLTLAAVLVKQGQTAEAVAERKKAAELMRGNMNRQRAEVSTHAGDGLLAKGDAAGAAERYRDAIGYDGGYGEAHAGLAKALDAMGRHVEAAAEREKVGVK